MKRLIGLYFVFFAAFRLFAASYEEANLLYANEKFAESIDIYEQLINEGYASSDLYYNLGNAYYRIAKLGPAILNYERALRIDPNNDDVLHNLEFVRNRTVDKIEVISPIFFVTWWRACRNCFCSDTWAWLCVFSLIAMLTMVGLYLFSRRILIRKIGFVIAIILLFWVIITFCMSSQSKSVALDTTEAIIYDQTITLKSSPDRSGTDLFLLHEGTKVVIKDALGEWVEVRIDNGNTGWLPASSIVQI